MIPESTCNNIEIPTNTTVHCSDDTILLPIMLELILVIRQCQHEPIDCYDGAMAHILLCDEVCHVSTPSIQTIESTHYYLVHVVPSDIHDDGLMLLHLE